MAQNVVINKNKTKGDTIAADSIAGVKHQQMKLEYGDTGQATQVSDTNPLPVKLATNVTSDDGTTDAFGRLRVSDPFSLFDSKQIYDKQPLDWVESATGGATNIHYPNLAATRMTCSTSSGDKAIRQSRTYIPYQPGKSFSVKLTGVMGAIKTSVRQRIGFFDDNNGLFFEQNGTALRVVRRTYTSGAAVDIAVNQEDWNIDKMDGTGNSGITLDMSKTQIFVIDFQWLGVGRVRFGFSVDGKLYYVHEMLHANVETNVYMSTPTLPCRYEIENTSTTASSTYMDQICASVVSEGGYALNGISFVAGTDIVTKTIATTLIPLIMLRLSSSYIRATLSNFSIDILNTGNANFRWGLFLNPTITGGTAASWSAVPNSYAEYDVAATGTVSGGYQIHGGFGSGGSTTQEINQDIFAPQTVCANISGTSDILVLAAQVTSGSDAFLGSIGWKEYH